MKKLLLLFCLLLGGTLSGVYAQQRMNSTNPLTRVFKESGTHLVSSDVIGKSKEKQSKNAASNTYSGSADLAGKWTFTFGDYYFDDSVGDIIEVVFEASVNGNEIKFSNPNNSRLPFIGKYSESNQTITFESAYLGLFQFQGGDSNAYHVYQLPFMYNGELVGVNSITGHYNPSSGVLTFTADQGLAWELYTVDDYFIGDFDILDFVSAKHPVQSGPTEIPVSSITLDKTSLNLKIGETYQLKANISPSNATNKTVTWSSSNSAVATVDNNGNIRAIKDGNATITAKSGSVSATCAVNVAPNNNIKEVNGIMYRTTDGSSDVMVVKGSYGALNYVTIPSSISVDGKTYNVTGIESEAFKNCTSLKEVILPSSIKTVGTDAFAGCLGLLKSSYPETLSNPFPYGDAIRYPVSCVLQNGIIYDSQKTKIYFVSIKTKGEFSIPSTVKSISDKAFKDCNDLNALYIGNSVTDIGDSAFENCTGLKNIKIDNLDYWCLINFANETANPLYNGQSLILDGAEIKDLTLPLKVSAVKDYAFISCTHFKSITIPENINSLGKKVFAGCNAVNTVTAYPQNPPTIADNSFSNYNATLYVPEASLSKYQNANYWKNFSNIELSSVVYLGIIGFNKELNPKPVGLLDLSTVDSYTDWVNNLTLNSNTLLYQAVDTGIATLQSVDYKNKLSNAVLVTFTDGLDQGSLALNYNFRTDQEYAQYLSEVISNAKVQDVPLQAYAIGVKGTDVSDDLLFMTNLNSLSSKPENVHQVSSMSQISAEFNAIYEDIVKQKDQLILTISVPVMSDGATCRFTFDNASNAESSKVWAQGTFNRSTMSLENITYEGLSSSTGKTIRGIQNGLNVSFTFFDCRDRNGNILQLPDKNYIDHWTYVASNKTWQHNVEMGNNDIELEKRNSTAVMMLIDCSSSIGSSDFENIQNVANVFIERLINYRGRYNTGVEEIYIDNDINRPMNIYTLQGICIKRNATEEDINNLPKGIYIIGGKKVLKR